MSLRRKLAALQFGGSHECGQPYVLGRARDMDRV